MVVRAMIWLSVWLACALPVQAATLAGRVVDPSGGAVPGVLVTVTGSTSSSATTAADGTFTIRDLPPGLYGVSASVPGAGAWRGQVTIAPGVDPPELAIVLELRIKDPPIVVTASRGTVRGSDPAAPVSVVTSSQLAVAASPMLDDVLRGTPGFSLFRRTSSRTANPTTQGATMRGLAASGASRALVLADGVALNDPFGGWVYWNRVPQASIDRVEVVRGAASDLYGADALGGVVQVLSAQASSAACQRLVLDGDSSATARASTFVASRRGAWSGTLAAEASRTDGTFIVDDEARGRVDRRAGADYLTGRAEGGVDGKGWRARAHVAAFGESRRNGTALQANDTSLREFAAEAAGPMGRGFVEIAGTAGDQAYHQSFTSVAGDRATETLTSRQTVPTSFTRGSVSYRLLLGTADVLAGYDGRAIWATNQDVAYFPSGAVRSVARAPGYDDAHGVYAQVRTPLGSRASVTAGMRNDWWYRDGGDAAVSEVSPRLTGSYRLSSSLVARGSVTRGFRAPTINERIRPFRAGNVLTRANAALDPERVTLGELGLAVQGRRASVLTSVFSSVVQDAVTNVTVSSTPELIIRQRRNAAEVRATGLEAEGDWRLASTLSLSGSLAYTRSTYRDTPGLSGNAVPQVPRWQGTVGGRWQAPASVMVQGSLRAVGAQFEDDRNTLVLRRATLVDVAGSRPLGRRASLVAAVENLFDVDYDTGRTPTRTIGTPLTVRIAVRLSY